MSPFPISEVCPACSSSDSDPVKVEAVLAFVDDQICRHCGTRYTPPTPVWMALLIIFVGLIFLAAAALFAFIAFTYVERGKKSLLVGSSLAISGGSYAIYYGIKALTRSSKH